MENEVESAGSARGSTVLHWRSAHDCSHISVHYARNSRLRGVRAHLLHVCDQDAESFLRKKPSWRGLDSLHMAQQAATAGRALAGWFATAVLRSSLPHCNGAMEVVAAAEAVAEMVEGCPPPQVVFPRLA
eukprot:COSAG02_NODE_241_length_27638_cov_13.101020_5_plen_130_part_00